MRIDREILIYFIIFLKAKLTLKLNSKINTKECQIKGR